MGSTCSSNEAINLEGRGLQQSMTGPGRAVRHNNAITTPFVTYIRQFDQIDGSRDRRTLRRPLQRHESGEIRNLIRAIGNMEGLFQMIGNSQSVGEGSSGPPPASAQAIEELPRVTMESDEHVSSFSECGICREQPTAGSIFVQMPCGHAYHSSCLNPWLRKHCTCPTCRYEITTSDPSYEPGRLERMRERDSRMSSNAHVCINEKLQSLNYGLRKDCKKSTSEDMLHASTAAFQGKSVLRKDSLESSITGTEPTSSDDERSDIFCDLG